MKKLLYISDSEEYWRVFTEESEKRRKRLQRLPFSEKNKIPTAHAETFRIFPKKAVENWRLGGF